MVGPGWASRCVDLRVAAAFSLLVSKIDFFLLKTGFMVFGMVCVYLPAKDVEREY
jgi:hypothetical protein